MTISGLPAGVTISPSSTSYTFPAGYDTTSPLIWVLSASSSAAVGQYTITISGSDGVSAHSYSVPLTVTAGASFHLSLSQSSLTIPAGTTGSIQATVVSDNSSPPPNVNLSVNGIGLQNYFNGPSISGDGYGTGPFTVSFTPWLTLPTVSNLPVYVIATDASNNTSTALLSLSSSVPYPAITAPTRSSFARTDNFPSDAFYDEARKLVFVTIPSSNEVRVYSSTDLHFVAAIPVAQNYFAPGASKGSIDESADGTKIYVGGVSGVAIIDPERLQVIGTISVPIETSSLIALAALPDGDLLLVDSGNAYLWNHSNGSMALTNPPNPTNLWYLPGFSEMIRSANREKVLLFGSQEAVVYDTATGSYGNPVTWGPYVPQPALSPDGSQIAIDCGGKPSIFNDSLAALGGQTNGPSAGGCYTDTPATSGVIYSLDGTTLYDMSDQLEAGEIGVAYNSQTLALLGVFYADDQLGPVTAPFTIDETGMIFGAPLTSGSADGFAATDASHPGAITADYTFSGITGQLSGLAAPELSFPSVLNVNEVSPSTTSSDSLQGAGFDPNSSYSVFIGAPPASPATLQATSVVVDNPKSLVFELPKGGSPGAANVTLTRSDGWYQIIPDGISYGPVIFTADPSAVPPSGGTQFNLWGYGLAFRSGTSGQGVTIGGNTATLTSGRQAPSTFDTVFPDVLDELEAPAGAPGSANITVNAAGGSATLQYGMRYLKSSQVYPVTGQLSALVYDRVHQRVYLANTDHNRIEVFDLASQSFDSPISVGNAPKNLALTPDDAELAVYNSADGTISVVNLGQNSVTATYTVFPSQSQMPFMQAITALEPHRILMVFGSGHLLNLDSGSTSCAGVPGCNSSGVIVPGFQVTNAASSPDGNLVYLQGTGAALINLEKNSITTVQNVSTPGGPPGINADGSVIISGNAVYDGSLNFRGIMGTDPPYMYTETDWELETPTLNPSGSLVFIGHQDMTQLPFDDVDVYDLHKGRLVLRIAEPEKGTSIPVLDETGTKLFLITQSGLSIEQLAAAPLSIISVTPNTGGSGTAVTIRGSGFVSGSTVTFGTTAASATLVDSMTLTATVPGLASGPVQVTVTNPNGQSYSFDAAFTAN